jgi:hypothetical protein
LVFPKEIHEFKSSLPQLLNYKKLKINKLVLTSPQGCVWKEIAKTIFCRKNEGERLFNLQRLVTINATFRGPVSIKVTFSSVYFN